MSTDDIERKFRGNVGKRWSKKRTDDVLKAQWTIQQTKNLSLLLGKMSL